MEGHFDDAVVGAGILGLAHALALARRGRRVVVVERRLRAQGASVRNFGMVWPIGQPAGPLRDVALASRARWAEVLRDAGLWHDPCGSLHLAYREDETAVLREFVAAEPAGAVEWLDPDDAAARSPGLRRAGLLGAAWSASELCVDPREVVAGLPAWLARAHGVRFAFGACAVGWDGSGLAAGPHRLRAARLWICPGAEPPALFPEALGGIPLVPCKLQMLRSAPMPGGWRIGPMLAGGLTLRHYRAFERCPSLPALRARVAAERPAYDALGIHVMVSQNGRGELVIGDSHVYGEAIDPFDDPAIDALVLDYLASFLDPPELRIAQRWNGVYAKHPSEAWVVVRPAPEVAIVTGAGGAGMTLSFGLAEQVVAETLGPA